MTSPGLPESPGAVALAVVTYRLGVLVGRRRDGNPLWTFAGGKIEPGESPEDAAVHDTLDATGLRVRVTGGHRQQGAPTDRCADRVRGLGSGG